MSNSILYIFPCSGRKFGGDFYFGSIKVSLLSIGEIQPEYFSHNFVEVKFQKQKKKKNSIT